jgi:hypothetical protein
VYYELATDEPSEAITMLQLAEMVLDGRIGREGVRIWAQGLESWCTIGELEMTADQTTLPVPIAHIVQNFLPMVDSYRATVIQVSSEASETESSRAQLEATQIELAAAASERASMAQELADAETTQAKMEQELAEAGAIRAKLDAQVTEIEAAARSGPEPAGTDSARARMAQELAETVAPQARLEHELSEAEAARGTNDATQMRDQVDAAEAAASRFIKNVRSKPAPEPQPKPSISAQLPMGLPAPKAATAVSNEEGIPPAAGSGRHYSDSDDYMVVRVSTAAAKTSRRREIDLLQSTRAHPLPSSRPTRSMTATTTRSSHSRARLATDSTRISNAMRRSHDRGYSARSPHPSWKR